MNDLLQKHGCSVVFSVPEGLKELMADITREVLRDQPEKVYDYITNYLSVLILTREHGLLAVKLLDDLCDCRPTVSEHLLQLGLERDLATVLSQIIKEEIEVFEPVDGKEKVKELQIMKKILGRVSLDEDMAERVCQVSRNAYRDYWYRKKLMEQALKTQPDEPWQIAAQRTLEIYKKTKPSFTELNRATQKIQAAYRGYYVRKNLLRHLKLKPKKTGPKVELPGPPRDIAGSRTIELGPVIVLNVQEDDVTGIYEKHTSKKLGLQYDTMKTITHVEVNPEPEPKLAPSARPSLINRKVSLLPGKKESVTDSVKVPLKVRPSLTSGRASTTTPIPSGHRISFAGLPFNIDLDDDDDDDDDDVPEDIVQPSAEIIPDVPDEDPDLRSEGDGRSTPSSAPASSPRAASPTASTPRGGAEVSEEEEN